MRMPAELYDYMLIAIRTRLPYIEEYRRHLISLGTVRDVEKRLRWDLAYDAIGSRWICDNVYLLGMNETHIDTALKQIMRTLSKES